MPPYIVYKPEITPNNKTPYQIFNPKTTSRSLAPPKNTTGRKNHNGIEVNGEKGSIYWNFEEQNYLYYYDRTCPPGEQGFRKIHVTHDDHPYNGGYWPQGHGIGYADTFVIEMANFLTAVAEGKPFKPDFEDGVKVQFVLDAVERSADKRQWIKVSN